MKQNSQDLLNKVKKLEVEISQLKKRKKYGLVWEEKVEEFDKKTQNAFPILKEKGEKFKDIILNKDADHNILIEGDNYHSLSVLAYTHKEKIDVIYVDPPYNTGARDWKYSNDFVDGNDTFRHSKWLSFMSKRLKLAKSLLKENGVICVTIDDYEIATLKLLMDEIFDEQNHLGTVVIRNNPKGRMTSKKVSLVHEYGIFFGKTSKSSVSKLPVEPEEKSHNYKKDKNGDWYVDVNLRKQGIDSSAIKKNGKLSERYFPIYYNLDTAIVSVDDSDGIKILPIDTSGQKRIWRRSIDVTREMCKSGELRVKNNKNGYQIYFKFRGGLDGRMPQSIWYDAKFSASDHGTRVLNNILDEREIFQYPKSPYAVMEAILTATANKEAVVLDFFAGSGTTGQAVLELNKEDGGSRKFILCTNNENGICEEVTYERVKRVMEGYEDDKGNKIDGLGENLKYLQTDYVVRDMLGMVTDEDRLVLTYKAGLLLALKESTFDIVKKTKSYQIFSSAKKNVGIYFSENKRDMSKFLKDIDDDKKQIKAYIFSWDKGAYKSAFPECEHIIFEDIPEPILEVYKQLI